MLYRAVVLANKVFDEESFKRTEDELRQRWMSPRELLKGLGREMFLLISCVMMCFIIIGKLIRDKAMTENIFLDLILLAA